VDGHRQLLPAPSALPHKGFLPEFKTNRCRKSGKQGSTGSLKCQTKRAGPEHFRRPELVSNFAHAEINNEQSVFIF